jgi:muramoyltetrapeptide carboxypeptidase
MSARFPPPVAPGARVGVAAVSGPVDPNRLDRGLRALAGLGFVPVTARNLSSSHDLFAGSDDERLDALHELADDDSLAAIFFARGGHGLLRLLPEIDWNRLGRRPRAWIGYSDLTPLLLGLVERQELVTFHGPMVAADLARGLSAGERASLLAALAGERGIVVSGTEVLATDSVKNLSSVEGVLLGGCLSLLAATLGTAWAPRLDGALLFLEDIGEPVYRLDRMLTHLHLSGSLRGVHGAVLGELRGSDEPQDRPSSLPSRVAAVVPEGPVLFGVEAGHVGPNRTLPLGAPARIDLRTRSLTVALASADR